MKCRTIFIPPYPLTQEINAGGHCRAPRVSPRSWAHAGACTSLLPGCSAAIPVGRTELCCPWAALGTVAAPELLPPAPGRCTSAEDSALPTPACPLLARPAAGHGAGSSWDLASAPWGPGTSAWGRHPRQPQHSVWISCRNPPPLCVPWCLETPQLPQNHHLEGFHLPSLLPCARGALRHGQGRGGVAAVRKQLVGAAGEEQKREKNRDRLYPSLVLLGRVGK